MMSSGALGLLVGFLQGQHVNPREKCRI